jgi:hypothetical protein
MKQPAAEILLDNLAISTRSVIASATPYLEYVRANRFRCRVSFQGCSFANRWVASDRVWTNRTRVLILIKCRTRIADSRSE